MRRVRLVILPISSAGMSSPRPHPRRTRAPEKRPHDGQPDSNSNEPRHDPPREWLRSQRIQPALPSVPDGIRKNQEGPNDCRGYENCPGMEYGKECDHDEYGDEDHAQVLRRPAAADPLTSDM